MSFIEYTVRDYGHVVKWYKKGTNILHRENGPAVVCKNGHKEYWQNNMLHNDSMNYKGEINPAIFYADGSLAYYRHGVLHRDNAPALRKTNGFNHLGNLMYLDYFYNNGILHNLNGPAISYNGSLKYFVNGIETNQIDLPHEAKIYKNITLKTAHCRDYIYSSIQKNPNQFPDLNKVILDYKAIVPNVDGEDLFLVLSRIAEKFGLSIKRKSFESAWKNNQ